MIERPESADDKLTYDSDDDLDVDRNGEGILVIGTEIQLCVIHVHKSDLSCLTEHSVSTELDLVGLQVWRGALLLADYILSHPDSFRNQTILELGSGVGLTSIVASYLAREVICTGKWCKWDIPISI